ncbi:EamA family transporter RarD [Pseudoduganella buxea]|uniref:EamA family transporter RarD n=1 Tax=Pseudoduganella buxea TaxID=1949069 RepID=A0A6I3SQQ0_9BURK|nr:EamA family transporter RarD [Pseudoduganella buxea]MTV51398.1 EamA family transporter RarD [Pseudoduganella buxea]GGC09919.1 membrane protein [Pseudoduganella buxea]
MNRGIAYAALAFLMWGLFPLYFKALAEVPPTQILAHRMVWSLLFLCGVLTVRRQWQWLPAVLRRPRVVATFTLSALLLSANWFIYIWAVNNGHVIDASLGYFINPLVNVLLGLLVLKERLRPGQWAAVGVAALGVLWLTWQAGQLPWIALLLAGSFGAYGLLRKTAALAALEGLSFETLLLFPLAGAYVVWLTLQGENAFLNTGSDTTRWLLVAAGPITAIPLLLFAAGARRIPLSVLGMLQYIGPTIQMLLGLTVFHETFTTARLAGFIVIWSALALYMLEGVWTSRRSAPATAPAG